MIPSFTPTQPPHNKHETRKDEIALHKGVILMEFPQGPICQSCGIPFRKAGDYGTNADGSRSTEYCFHCHQYGRFLDEGITLQEKIEKNVRFGVQMGMAEDMARHMCETILP
jgi:hypothetical protein